MEATGPSTNLRDQNLAQLIEQSAALRGLDISQDTFTVADKELIKYPSYTVKDIAAFAGVTSDRVKNAIKKLEAEGEYFARDSRNWHMATRGQALKLMAHFGKKTVQELRAERPDDYETPRILVHKGKGGVAKTTSAIHIAVEAAMDPRKNRRVLLFDGDTQGSIKHYLMKVASDRIEPSFESLGDFIQENGELSREERLSPEKQQYFREFLVNNGFVLQSRVDNLWYTPSNLRDINISVMLAAYLVEKEGDLDFAISIYNDLIIKPLSSMFELIVIDSGPAPDMILQNLLYASNHLIIPTTGRRQDFRAYRQFLELLTTTIQHIMPPDWEGLSSIRTLICKHSRKAEYEEVANALVAHVNCFSSRIFESKKYEDAATNKLPMQIYNTSGTGDICKTLTALYAEIEPLISAKEFKNSKVATAA